MSAHFIKRNNLVLFDIFRVTGTQEAYAEVQIADLVQF